MVQTVEMLTKESNPEPEYPALIHMHGPSDEARVLQLEQHHLYEHWIDALNAEDAERIESARSKYDANVQSLLTLLGQDAPCNFVDSDLWGDYSDFFKSLNGYRPRINLSRAEVQQWFKDHDSVLKQTDEQ